MLPERSRRHAAGVALRSARGRHEDCGACGRAPSPGFSVLQHACRRSAAREPVLDVIIQEDMVVRWRRGADCSGSMTLDLSALWMAGM